MKEQHLFFTVNNNVYVGIVTASRKKMQQLIEYTVIVEHNRTDEILLSFKNSELLKSHSSTKMDTQLSDVLVKTLMADPRFPDKFVTR